MKILYYSPHPHVNMAAPSGPGTHIREVITGFENRGHKVIKFIAGGEELSNSGAPIMIKKRVWKKFIPSYVWQSLKDYRLSRTDAIQAAKLAEIIQQEKPDLIYERAYYLMQSGYTTAAKSGISYCCEINAPYPEEKSAMDGKSIFLARANENEKKQVAAAKKVFVVSTALRDYLGARIPGSREKIVVTPNAVNLQHIRVDETKVNALRTKWGIPGTDVVIGFVGSIFPYHGVDLLIDAFEKLSRNNTKLLIVGDGETLKALREKVDSSGLKHKVIFTGNIPHSEIYHYITLMDITVMARSNWYGSPVKIFEYGAMKKSIIAPDVIPVQDVMENMKDGLLIKDNVPSLLSALTYLMDHPKEAQQMAEHFYQKVVTQYTWQQVSDTILNEAR